MPEPPCLTPRRFGALHCAIINAGVEGARAATHEYPTDAFDALMAVNLRGSWLCLKHLTPLLLAAGRQGAVVITSSTAGERAGAKRRAVRHAAGAMFGRGGDGGKVAANENTLLGCAPIPGMPSKDSAPNRQTFTSWHCIYVPAFEFP